jgi:uncharacterized protein YbjT (DUF2867 family)
LRVLVLGAGGFIGGHTTAALRAGGHDVLAGKVDFARAHAPGDWLPALEGIDAVVNAVGIIRGRRGRSFEALHFAAPRALFDACATAGVRRVVQISALGADAAAQSRFHRSKRAADEHLAALDLDWAIVQPSLVFGEQGSSARLFMLLAALPVTPLPGDGRQRVQPIHIEDLTELVVKLLQSPGRRTVEAVGPRAITLREWLCLLRAQLGLGPARFFEVPLWAVPLERETLQMLQRGSTASPAPAARILGRPARDPREFVTPARSGGLALRAKLDWLRPLLRHSIGLLWIVSGVLSLGLFPVEQSLAMLGRVGLTGTLASVALYGAAALDIALGLATITMKTAWLWRVQIALVLGYTALITLYLPELWLHPFGPVLENLPILAALVALHELEERR